MIVTLTDTEVQQQSDTCQIGAGLELSAGSAKHLTAAQYAC